MRERGDDLITSVFTFGEVLAGAYRRRTPNTVEQTNDQLLSIIAEIVPFTMETVDHYARIRASLVIRPPDAIHLASAAQAGTDLFITNDNKLIGKVIPGIQFIAGLDSNIL
jgi:predicted nucleic acid-binding protein